MRTIAMVHSALLADRLPPRFNRWRIVFPDDACSGLAPHNAANAASFFKCSGFIPCYSNKCRCRLSINKYLRENDLKPTPDHSLYSLRHTFKDRLRDAQAPKEIVDELMGHKKSGPKYSHGHIMERKLEWMRKIAFNIPKSLQIDPCMEHIDT